MSGSRIWGRDNLLKSYASCSVLDSACSGVLHLFNTSCLCYLFEGQHAVGVLETLERVVDALVRLEDQQPRVAGPIPRAEEAGARD